MGTMIGHRAGFTLVEMLAALAIASAIIVSIGMMIHQSVFFFDHGTHTIDRSEELALAIDSLTRDFGATRFVLQKTGKASDTANANPKNANPNNAHAKGVATKGGDAKNVKAAFSGMPANEDEPAKILFITAGGKTSRGWAEEVVSLTSEPGDGMTRLVRRRAAWTGPRMKLEDAELGDPVILLKGDFSIGFSFSELTKDGRIVWHDMWTGELGVPRSVRVSFRDFETNNDLLPGMEFRIHADAPIACASGESGCLSISGKGDGDAKGKSQDQQTNQNRQQASQER
ncbi:prepilin-type N-terminal cleavage/methylation domain-containing protein [Methyloferula stellata]|uniref:prepilin-type N-terminal cleavage/methylation domain-containing protein n=1 Tax=Methyloferula stellata TaxID=876270 RepID=UPI0003669F75|nr:prepilin-type N-terminal cleavage/methylation domain-containing protein [Methyloferula stellata]